MKISYVLRSSGMLQGGNYVVRREALKKIGGYNTNIDFYGEDTDIAKRISEVGKVKFTFRFPMYASGRRLAAEGTFTMGLRDTLNYFWMVLFKKLFSLKYLDIKNGWRLFSRSEQGEEIDNRIFSSAYIPHHDRGKAEAQKISGKINELSKKPTKELKNNIKR